MALLYIGAFMAIMGGLLVTLLILHAAEPGADLLQLFERLSVVIAPTMAAFYSLVRGEQTKRKVTRLTASVGEVDRNTRALAAGTASRAELLAVQERILDQAKRLADEQLSQAEAQQMIQTAQQSLQSVIEQARQGRDVLLTREEAESKIEAVRAEIAERILEARRDHDKLFAKTDVGALADAVAERLREKKKP